mmetsp:Transcript_6096/g.6023  ORF Transcript_6096/g.6023 Transcript_6096/m.6023 type:complete len:336 (+) Transcript_6096:1749-2756(+)
MNNSRDLNLPHDKSHPTDNSSTVPENNATSSSLLEQLVYIDNFMHTNSGSTGEPTPNLDMDGQLSLDLAAFADDSFIFPDEDKKPGSPYLNNNNGNNGNDDFSNHNHNGRREPNNDLNRLDHDLIRNHIPGTSANHDNSDFHQPRSGFNEAPHLNVNVSNLPKWPVPPGAKSSLESAGLLQNQIELLSALVAQHQLNLPSSQPTAQQTAQHTAQPRSNSTRSPSIATSADGGYDGQGINDAVNSAASNSDEHSNESELDKRRRNTAASARFRIKKKMKEKQMEDRIQSLNEMIKTFESKTQQLEMENKLLKNLIIEKGSQKSEYELRMLKERARQ